MNSISNNPVYVEGIRYTTGIDNIQKNINQPGQSNVLYDKYFSQDLKNIIVSEKPDKYSSTANYYRYQYSSPASRLMNAGQTFNEIEKPFSNNSSGSQGNQRTANNSSRLNYDNYNAVSGYFILDNGKQKKLNKRPDIETANPMKKKLAKTYHLDNNSEPGSLVNMTYY